MAKGSYTDYWQQVVDSQVVGYVDDSGITVNLPDVHEAYTLTGQLLDAPNGNLVTV